MNPSVAAAVLVGLVLFTVAVGFFVRLRSDRKRLVRVADLTAADLGIPHLGEAATVVQLSTEYCAKCPSVHRALAAEFTGADGVLFMDVDLTHEPEFASRLRVMQTPTVLVVDATGHVTARFAGAVRAAAVRAETDTFLRGNNVQVAT